MNARTTILSLLLVLQACPAASAATSSVPPETLANELTAVRYENWRRIKQNQPPDVRKFLAAFLRYAATLKAGVLYDDQTVSHSVFQLFSFIRKCNYTPAQEMAVIESLKASPNVTLQLMAAAKEQGLKLRDKPVDVEFTTFDGTKLNLKAFRGKVLLVDMWHLECAGCISGMPGLERVREKYRAQGFEVVAVHFSVTRESDAAQQAKAMAVLEKAGATGWSNCHFSKDEGSRFQREYGIAAFPGHWLFDRYGRFVTSNLDRDNLESEVRRLLARPALVN